jgi:hypothetical protein
MRPSEVQICQRVVVASRRHRFIRKGKKPGMRAFSAFGATFSAVVAGLPSNADIMKHQAQGFAAAACFRVSASIWRSGKRTKNRGWNSGIRDLEDTFCPRTNDLRGHSVWQWHHHARYQKHSLSVFFIFPTAKRQVIFSFQHRFVFFQLF